MLNNKFFQRFFAISPLICFFLIVVGYLFFVGTMLVGASYPPKHELFYLGLGGFVFLVFLATIFSISNLIYFVIHAIKNPNLEQNNNRIVWILVIVLANGIGSIIYWIAEIEFKKPRPIVS